jgi:hypothetical protein
MERNSVPIALVRGIAVLKDDLLRQLFLAGQLSRFFTVDDTNFRTSLTLEELYRRDLLHRYRLIPIGENTLPIRNRHIFRYRARNNTDTSPYYVIGDAPAYLDLVDMEGRVTIETYNPPVDYSETVAYLISLLPSEQIVTAGFIFMHVYIFLLLYKHVLHRCFCRSRARSRRSPK